MPQLVTKSAIHRVPDTHVTGTEYRVDSKASLFTVRAFAGGLISAAAHNPEFAIRDFVGDVQFDANAPAKNSLKLQIKSGFFELTNDVSAQDRQFIQHVMNDEVLEVQQYPEISFVSSSVTVQRLYESMFRADIMGNLTLHGATRKLEIIAQLVLGDDTLRATGNFTVLQSEFGLKIATVANGSLKVRDELRFCFYVLARRTATAEGKTTDNPVLH